MEDARRDFHHPYEPYDIQNEMMDAVYDCISKGQVGIFESPTGTGKSLSLICSSLTWLRDFQDGILQEQELSDQDDHEPDWVLEHTKADRRKSFIEQKLVLERRLQRIRNQELNLKKYQKDGKQPSKKLKTSTEGSFHDDHIETQFIPDDYDSGDEIASQANKDPGAIHHEGLSTASIQLMEKLGVSTVPDNNVVDLQPVDETKIFYCSRTHSQLTQFVREIQRVKLRPVSWFDDATASVAKERLGSSFIKHLPLGSRKNLCINPNVSKLGSTVAISERCLELQQQGISQEHKCAFLPTKENETLVNEFRDHTLAKIQDIEDLGSLGKKIGICPYYSTRATIKPSEIITLPYPLLLQKSAREALDVSLKGNIVIIDEAHNLVDAISNIHSITVTQSQLRRCRAQLGLYLNKFRNRLKGKNRVYVTQVVRLIDSISAYLENVASNGKQHDGVLNVSDLMGGKGVDQINLYKLMRYLGESKLARKVEHYIAHAESQEPKSSSKIHPVSVPVLIHVQSFLQSLTNPASEGRFFYEKDEKDQTSIKYLLLDPTHHFRDVIEGARAVILAGGTMSPMSDYVRHLFPYITHDLFKIWSCGHIIPKDNLVVWPVAKGLDDFELDFTYSNRKSSAIMHSLGISLVKLLVIVPDGVVVFFPSYSYLDQVVLSWQQDGIGTSGSIWNHLSKQKPIFREVKDVLGTGDLLEDYARAVDSGKGGLLLSVIGGKMSEGINFSDRLGRGIVVVGLPFPNIQSAQWKAKLEYIEKTAVDQGKSRDESKAASREFYENACMRAVNQSIGRAIRHRNDFASIILLDRRYQTPRILEKLPAWIQQSLVQSKGNVHFQSAIQGLEAFFRGKR